MFIKVKNKKTKELKIISLKDYLKNKKKYKVIKKYNPFKTGKYAKYKHIRLKEPSLFEKKSFRTIPIGKKGKKLIIGKLKGHKKTTSQAILLPLKKATEKIDKKIDKNIEKIKSFLKDNKLYKKYKKYIKNPVSLKELYLVYGGKLKQFDFYFPHNEKLIKFTVRPDEVNVYYTSDMEQIILYPVFVPYKINEKYLVKNNFKNDFNLAKNNYKKFTGFTTNFIQEKEPIDIVNIISIGFVDNNVIEYFIRKNKKRGGIGIYTHKFNMFHNVYLNKDRNAVIIKDIKVNWRGILN